MAETDPKLIAALARAEILQGEADPSAPLYAALGDLIQQARLGQKRLNRLIRRSDATEAKLVEANRKMETLTVSLSRFVPATVVDALMRGESARLAGVDRKNLTIFFSDIVGFTTIASRLEPEPLAELLMEYFTEMTEICTAHGGTLDQFIGDAMVIFFGDPETCGAHQDAAAAVAMALAMQDRLAELRDAWYDRGFSQNIHVRMGISTGYCHVGNFGSGSRLHYTVIGNAANEASRIQESARPDTVMISNDTWLLVKNRFDCTDHGTITLKGRESPLTLYQVCAPRSGTERIRLEGAGYNLRLDPAQIESPHEVITALEATIRRLKKG